MHVLELGIQIHHSCSGTFFFLKKILKKKKERKKKKKKIHALVYFEIKRETNGLMISNGRRRRFIP